MTHDSDFENSSDQASAGPPGYSGKKVTLVVVSSLILVGLWMSYTLYVYGRIDAARERSAVAWRNLVDELAERYRRAERSVAKGVDSGEIDMRLGERFRLSMDRFRTTAQPDMQYAAARELEEQLDQVFEAFDTPQSLRAAVKQFNESLAQEQAWLASPAGQFLSIFIQFAEPEPLRLAS